MKNNCSTLSNCFFR